MVHPAIPDGAEQPNVLNGLVRKRAEIAGRIEANQQELRRLIADLDSVEATIRVFDPTVDLNAVHPRPVPPRHAAFKGEVSRIVFVSLRQATTPITSRQIAVLMVKERGLNPDDRDLMTLMTKRVGACLNTQCKRGVVRSVRVPGPLLGWELAR